jgi:chromosome segregation ATPase
VDLIQKNKKWIGLAIANGGVGISLLWGGFQFLTTYEQTADEVAWLSEEVATLVRHEQIDDLYIRVDDIEIRNDQQNDDLGDRTTRLETQRDELQERGYKLDELENAVQMILERLATFEADQRNAQEEGWNIESMRDGIASLKERLAGFESTLNQLDRDSYKLEEFDDRLDILDDFVVRWDEQANAIMSEHAQFSDIIRELWEALDQRGAIPGGLDRTYGYD